MVSERKEGGGVFDELRHADMEQDRSILDAPDAPLPKPGEGGPVSPGNVIQPLPVQPLPTITYAVVRFLNAAYGYPAFRVYVGNRRAAGLLNFASLSGYTRLAAGLPNRDRHRHGRLYLHPEDHSV